MHEDRQSDQSTAHDLIHFYETLKSYANSIWGETCRAAFYTISAREFRFLSIGCKVNIAL